MQGQLGDSGDFRLCLSILQLLVRLVLAGGLHCPLVSGGGQGDSGKLPNA